MPCINYQIGTIVTTPRYGTSVVIGYFNDPTVRSQTPMRMLHIYSFMKDRFACIKQVSAVKISDPDYELLEKGRNALMQFISKTPNDNFGRLFTHQTELSTFEYLQIIGNHRIDNEIYGLFAYRTTSKYASSNEWTINYLPTSRGIFQLSQPANKTPESIQMAKTLLLERVIMPAFTTI